MGPSLQLDKPSVLSLGKSFLAICWLRKKLPLHQQLMACLNEQFMPKLKFCLWLTSLRPKRNIHVCSTSRKKQNKDVTALRVHGWTVSLINIMQHINHKYYNECTNMLWAYLTFYIAVEGLFTFSTFWKRLPPVN